MTNTELKSKLAKSIDFLKVELSQIRTGRASPTLIENISVEAYGSNMTVKELGGIAVSDSQTLYITPWDKSVLASIMKGIRDSGLGLNPIDDSGRIRITIPALTEERRKEYTKIVSTKVEECKNALRAVRQEAMKDIDKDFADKLMGEDEKFKLKEDVEKLIKEYVESSDEVGESKKTELLTI